MLHVSRDMLRDPRDMLHDLREGHARCPGDAAWPLEARCTACPDMLP